MIIKDLNQKQQFLGLVRLFTIDFLNNLTEDEFNILNENTITDDNLKLNINSPLITIEFNDDYSLSINTQNMECTENTDKEQYYLELYYLFKKNYPKLLEKVQEKYNELTAPPKPYFMITGSVFECTYNTDKHFWTKQKEISVDVELDDELLARKEFEKMTSSKSYIIDERKEFIKWFPKEVILYKVNPDETKIKLDEKSILKLSNMLLFEYVQARPILTDLIQIDNDFYYANEQIKEEWNALFTYNNKFMKKAQENKLLKSQSLPVYEDKTIILLMNTILENSELNEKGIKYNSKEAEEFMNLYYKNIFKGFKDNFWTRLFK